MGTYNGFNVPAFAFEEERKKAMEKAIGFAKNKKGAKKENE